MKTRHDVQTPNQPVYVLQCISCNELVSHVFACAWIRVRCRHQNSSPSILKSTTNLSTTSGAARGGESVKSWETIFDQNYQVQQPFTINIQ